MTKKVFNLNNTITDSVHLVNPFLHTFHVYIHMMGRIGTFQIEFIQRTQLSLRQCNPRYRWKFQLYQMTEFESRMSFLEFRIFHTSQYVSIFFFIMYMNFLKGNESFLVTSGHVVETDLVQFIVYWLMYIIIGKEVWSGYNLVLWCVQSDVHIDVLTF